MNTQNQKIICRACGKKSLLKRTPIYEGFKKTGEKLSCLNCGHVFEKEEDIQYVNHLNPSIFKPNDKSKNIKVFRDEETAELCRYCKYYVVNPFVQRCTYLNKNVEATDSCEHFEAKEETKPSKE